MQDLIIPSQYADLIQVSGQEAYTTSLTIADKFDKQHKNVLQAIEVLECSTEFREKNFLTETYTDSTGRTLPSIRMTKDGMMFLAMGFTGQKAAEWRERFIAAFNYVVEESQRLFKENVKLQSALYKASLEHDPTKIQLLKQQDIITSAQEDRRARQEMKNELEDLKYEIIQIGAELSKTNFKSKRLTDVLDKLQ